VAPGDSHGQGWPGGRAVAREAAVGSAYAYAPVTRTDIGTDSCTGLYSVGARDVLNLAGLAGLRMQEVGVSVGVGGTRFVKSR